MKFDKKKCVFVKIKQNLQERVIIDELPSEELNIKTRNALDFTQPYQIRKRCINIKI